MIFIIFAISDLHLSETTEKPMDIFGEAWADHTARLKKNWCALVGEEDTVIIPGDISWGMNLREALADFLLIDALPGKKIIAKGNHDYWWETASKTMRFFDENGISTIRVLHNNAYEIEGKIICGSKGYFPDPGQSASYNEKIMARETARLEFSLRCGEKLGGGERLVFLHYPPALKSYAAEGLMDVMKRYGVSRCFYGHLHGQSQRSALLGLCDGIEFSLISADFIIFAPIPIK
ncbi:metallophosphoesterase [Feifania hominis]|uniref:Metallophosphoesterase n=1 Tax=Feifania hominis TaxID=2763660 RepID=A0A926DD22_9FIRM|nr:metallophosphoesterase [Feifania hominis]